MLDNSQEIMVCVHCATYNQEKYIAQTIEGFLMQKTDFPFVVVVTDDASTDNNPKIIQEYANKYPDIIKPVFLQENHYQKKLSKRKYYAPWDNRAKYLAYCEGDDYWTDPLKLQKQVDFLNAHPDYTICCHNWSLDKEGEIMPSPVQQKYPHSFSFTFETLPWVWITKTLTLMLRFDAMDYDTLERYKFSRDVHIIYHLLKKGKGFFMADNMATYRITDSGIWSKVDPNQKNRTTYELYKELYQYEPNKAVRKRYMNATLAYFNGLAFGKKTWRHFGTNTKLYFEALRNISDAKDIVFCLGGLVPTQLVKWVMKSFKV